MPPIAFPRSASLHRLARVATLPALLAAALPAAAQQDAPEWLEQCRQQGGRDDWAVHCEVREYRLPAGSSLRVNARPNGGIRVEAWDRDEIHVEARVRARGGSEEEARELASEVEVLASGGSVRSEGPFNRGRRGWSVSYRVRVPRRIDLQLASTNGGLHVSGVTGDLGLSTTNGGIQLERVAGSVRGETVNGGLSVRLAGERWEGSGLTLRTTNGGVDVYLPEGYNARLEAGAVNGRISTDFPVTVQGRIGRRIEGDIGRGGPPIRIQTTNGGIELRRG